MKCHNLTVCKKSNAKLKLIEIVKCTSLRKKFISCKTKEKRRRVVVESKISLQKINKFCLKS